MPVLRPRVSDRQSGSEQRLGHRLRFVFRNFPLAETHPHAEHAAEAAEAAARAGSFWEMHDALFEHQTRSTMRHLVEYAATLGLDEDADFTTSWTATRSRRAFATTFMSGVRSGVNGTPTFFINGERYDESWDLETFLRALEPGPRLPLTLRRDELVEVLDDEIPSLHNAVDLVLDQIVFVARSTSARASDLIRRTAADRSSRRSFSHQFRRHSEGAGEVIIHRFQS